MITLYVRFIVVCRHSKIVLYVLFILSCTTLKVQIGVHSICIIIFLRKKYFASLQHRHNWCQLPLHIVRRPSRANGGAPVLAPMVALLFWWVLTSVRTTPAPPTPHPVHPFHRSHVGSNQPAHRNPSRANGGDPVTALPFQRALTTVRPTPVPPMPHPVHPPHPSHPSSNQPIYKSRCVLIQMIRYDPIKSSRSNPANPADTIQSNDTIQPILCDPANKGKNSTI